MEASNVCRNMWIVRPVLAQVFRVPGRRIVMTPEEVTPLFLTAPDKGSTGHRAAKTAQILSGEEKSPHDEKSAGR
jgi:hypothetical protein